MTTSIENARELAHNVALSVAGESGQVGDFVDSVELGEGVTDFRFTCRIPGYEGWQWAITLYHDEETDEWTVDESALVPTEQSLIAPKWVPWKDRLTADDLSVTDAIGTDPDDPRMEEGFRPVVAQEASTGRADAEVRDEDATKVETQTGARQLADQGANKPTDSDSADASEMAEEPNEFTDGVNRSGDAVEPDAAGGIVGMTGKAQEAAGFDGSGDAETAGTEQADDMDDVDPKADTADADDSYADEDQAEAVEALMLSRRHVMSPLGRSEAAKRWYRGQHGPKSLSTKTADGNLCSTCAFFVPLVGELGSLFGVCANKWSVDDGKVVSMDHGCGEHSEIEQPEASHLWVQTKPAYDDVHIDVVEKTRRNRHAQVELLERVAEDAAATE